MTILDHPVPTISKLSGATNNHLPPRDGSYHGGPRAIGRQFLGPRGRMVCVLALWEADPPTEARCDEDGTLGRFLMGLMCDE
jgi:hypothetical protein